MPRRNGNYQDSRPQIGLGHASSGANVYNQQAANPYGQVWDTPFDRPGAWARETYQDPSRAAGYDSYREPPRRSAGYNEDPYYADARPSRYGEYETPSSMYAAADYGSYQPRQQPAYADYAPSYDNFSAPPRPLMYDSVPQRDNRRKRQADSAPYQYRGGGGARNKNQQSYGQSYGGPKNREPKRKRESLNKGASGRAIEKPKVEAQKQKNGDEDANDEEKPHNAKFLFQYQDIDNAEELFEKCNTLGEARQRQFRYKVYRVLSTLGLDFVTITEQQGTFSKNGTVNMKIMLKNFFPQFFVGEATGTDHERACYDATIQLSLKLNKLGLLPTDTIAMFYHKKLHYKPEKFEKTKADFQLLIDEINKHESEFTPEFKEGKVKSETQMALLEKCISTISEQIRQASKSEPKAETAKATADAQAENNGTNAEAPEKLAAETEPKPEDESNEVMECTDEA